MGAFLSFAGNLPFLSERFTDFNYLLHFQIEIVRNIVGIDQLAIMLGEISTDFFLGLRLRHISWRWPI